MFCDHVLFSHAANGADMTIESDTGYTPMALAVALGHKKSMCDFLTRDFLLVDYNFIFTVMHFKVNENVRLNLIFFSTVQKELENYILNLYKPLT